MVQRKLYDAKPAKERKVRVQKVSSKKFDLDALPDAVVDGKICMTPDSKCVISRWGRELHNCTYLNFDEKFNIIELWDDTVQHMYSVSLNEPIPQPFKVTKMASSAAKVTPPINPVEATSELESVFPSDVAMIDGVVEITVEADAVIEQDILVVDDCDNSVEEETIPMLSDDTLTVEADEVSNIQDNTEEAKTLSADNNGAIEQL